MSRKIAMLWATAILTVALLNIVDVLPGWATIAAVLTLPFVAMTTGGFCSPMRKD